MVLEAREGTSRFCGGSSSCGASAGLAGVTGVAGAEGATWVAGAEGALSTSTLGRSPPLLVKYLLLDEGLGASGVSVFRTGAGTGLGAGAGLGAETGLGAGEGMGLGANWDGLGAGVAVGLGAVLAVGDGTALGAGDGVGLGDMVGIAFSSLDTDLVAPAGAIWGLVTVSILCAGLEGTVLAA